jgi:iron complex transport system ATP-binding protein
VDKSAIISLRNASLGYSKGGHSTQILKVDALELYPGDFIGIVGLNGIGKSTLLKTICGLLSPLKGDIAIDGKSLSDIPLAELAKKVSIVLTEKIGGFNLKAFDAVAAGQIPYTNSFHQLKAENLQVIEQAMAATGITGHAHKLLSELSDGLFQKTVIAKALAQQTPIMLLDEPSAFLDYASKHDLFILLKKLAEEQQKCILLSSHDLDLILKYCHKLLVVSEAGQQLIPASEAKSNSEFLKIAGGFIK